MSKSPRAGAGGLTAAIAAREKGASVLIVEKNFDIGGRAMMSSGGLYIGGGNRLQKAKGVGDMPDLAFADWSRPEKPIGRFSDRELVRTWADNNLDLFDWLEKHGIKLESYRGIPDRLDRNRTRLNVVRWPDEPTTPARGSGFVRPLEKTARQMGIEVLLQLQMTKIHRESPLAGRATGITVIVSQIILRIQPLRHLVPIKRLISPAEARGDPIPGNSPTRRVGDAGEAIGPVR
jgi:succinate dehydrogenase/fumarate reductase flavoprotein subunit